MQKYCLERTNCIKTKFRAWSSERRRPAVCWVCLLQPAAPHAVSDAQQTRTNEQERSRLRNWRSILCCRQHHIAVEVVIGDLPDLRTTVEDLVLDRCKHSGQAARAEQNDVVARADGRIEAI